MILLFILIKFEPIMHRGLSLTFLKGQILIIEKSNDSSVVFTILNCLNPPEMERRISEIGTYNGNV